MGYFPVRYDSRVVIYERKMFIRLVTGLNISIFESNQRYSNSFTKGCSLTSQAIT